MHAQLSLSTFGCEWLHSYCQWVALLVPPIHDFVCLGVISACWPIQRALFMQAQNCPQSCRSARPVPPLSFWLFLAGLPVPSFFTDGTTNWQFLRRIKVPCKSDHSDNVHGPISRISRQAHCIFAEDHRKPCLVVPVQFT